LASEQEFFDVSKASVRRSMTLLALGAVIGLAIAGYGLFTAKGTRSHGVPPEAIALVNQRQILRSDFMTQAQTEFTVPFAQTTREQRRKVLEDMIDEELMMQRGLEIDLPSYDPDVRNALVAGVELEVTADVLAQQPTPDELHAYYDQHKDKYSSEGVMQLRDLVIKSRPAVGARVPAADARVSAADARAAVLSAIAALRSGQKLETVIEKFNLVDSGRFMEAGHGDTGDIFQFAVRAKVDDVLYDAIAPLKDGEFAGPVVEADGAHLIAMIKHRFPVPQTFDEAGNLIWTDYKKDAQAKVRAANIAYLRSLADIVVAPGYGQ
jgi:parvulin-like peptidyl-prolyl isomerase